MIATEFEQLDGYHAQGQAGDHEFNPVQVLTERDVLGLRGGIRRVFRA